MKKMRIGIIVDQLLAGGVQLSAIEQVKTLNRLGYQTKLLILMRKSYPTDFSYLVKTIPHEYLSDRYPKIFQKTVKFPIFSFLSSLHLLSPLLAPRVIKKDVYDVLISMGTTTSITTQAIYKLNRIPYIAVIHDPIVYILETSYKETPLRFLFPFIKLVAKRFEGSFIHDAKKTLIISQVHYLYLKKNYGIEPVVLPIGTDPVVRIPHKRGDLLLSFGRWQLKKNPLLLLKLLQRIPKAKLVLAGSWTDSEELAEFKREITREGLEQRVKLVTHYTPKILSRLCSQARVFIHPHFEAFGLAALEAAGHGVPIIIPQKSGVTEGFTHGVHGYFPKKGNIKEYQFFTSKLLADSQLAYRMGLAAWKKVKATFSWEAIVKRLLEIINQFNKLDYKPTILVLETGHSLGTYLAGGDKLMEPMARRLTNQFEFSVIIPEIGAKHWQESPISKKLFILPRNVFDRKGTPVPVFLTYCLRMWQTIILIWKQYPRSEIIYSSTNILPDILPAAIARICFPVFWVARIHHLIPPPYKREGRFLVNTVSYFMQMLALLLVKFRADLVMALNESLRNELMMRNFPVEKIETIGAGIDVATITAYKVIPKAPAYAGIFLGRLHPTKGIFDLNSIWKLVAEKIPTATLAIIGGGEYQTISRLKRMVENSGLTRHAFLLGVLPDTEVITLMKNAKVFLFTDHESGWGLAVAEAMACGLPVVGYHIGVLDSVYQSGFTEVPLGDLQGFAQKIIQLLHDETHRRNLAKLAQKTVSTLDWSYTTDAFKNVLTKHFTHYRP